MGWKRHGNAEDGKGLNRQKCAARERKWDGIHGNLEQRWRWRRG
jgi:hypothetical protein